MSSINTNVSALTALQTLTATNKALAQTQNRISTGQRVSTAADNAAYWSIATGMRTQNGALSAVQDALGLGAAVLDTAASALEEAISKTELILEKYVARATPGIDTAAIDAEISQLKDQVISIAQNANFEGVNMLKTGGSAASIVVGYDKSAATPVSTMTVAAYDLEAAPATITDTATAETALTAMKSAAATIGAGRNRVESQQTFTSKLMDAIDRGVGQLVDADMEKESARLSALQVKQQLGIQSLSIANSSTQNVLALFR